MRQHLQRHATQHAERDHEHAHREHAHRERDSEAARQSILEAAEECFARAGFSGARVDVIAEVAGYNKSLIFQYFGDKLGLYHAVVGRMKARVEEELGAILAPYAEEAAPDAPCVASFIQTMMRWSFDHYLKYPLDRAILVWETAEGFATYNFCAVNSPNACPSAQANTPRMLWPHVAANFLRRAQQTDVIRTDLDPDVLLAHAMGMALFYLASLPRFAIVLPEAGLGSPAALATAREQFVALMLHGTMTPMALRQVLDSSGIPKSLAGDTESSLAK